MERKGKMMMEVENTCKVFHLDSFSSLYMEALCGDDISYGKFGSYGFSRVDYMYMRDSVMSNHKLSEKDFDMMIKDMELEQNNNLVKSQVSLVWNSYVTYWCKNNKEADKKNVVRTNDSTNNPFDIFFKQNFLRMNFFGMFMFERDYGLSLKEKLALSYDRLNGERVAWYQAVGLTEFLPYLVRKCDEWVLDYLVAANKKILNLQIKDDCLIYGGVIDSDEGIVLSSSAVPESISFDDNSIEEFSYYLEDTGYTGAAYMYSEDIILDARGNEYNINSFEYFQGASVDVLCSDVWEQVFLHLTMKQRAVMSRVAKFFSNLRLDMMDRVMSFCPFGEVFPDDPIVRGLEKKYKYTISYNLLYYCIKTSLLGMGTVGSMFSILDSIEFVPSGRINHNVHLLYAYFSVMSSCDLSSCFFEIIAWDFFSRFSNLVWRFGLFGIKKGFMSRHIHTYMMKIPLCS